MDAPHRKPNSSGLSHERVSSEAFAVVSIRRLKRRAERSAAGVALGYAVIGVAWIVFSDRWLAQLSRVRSMEWLPISQYKGIGFVVVTAVALFLLMRWGLFRWHRVAAKVRDSESLMRSVIQTMPDALLVWDDQGVMVFANHHAEAVLGLAPGHMLGMRYDDLRWAITRPDGSKIPREELPFAKAVSGASPVINQVLCVQPHSGGRRVLSVNAAPLFAPDGSISGVVSSASDMTARHQAEHDMQRTSRALHALADLGAFALHAHTPLEIYDYACAALVEHDICVLSWVGKVELNARRSILPIASRGTGTSYVDALRVTWDSSATGMGPIGRAVRELRPVVFNRLDQHPDFAPWIESAREQGFVSAFAVPILDSSGSPRYVVTGYSSEAAAFGPSECDVLNEFAQRIGTSARAVKRRVLRDEREEITRVALEGTIRAVQHMVELRDPYTHGHEERVAQLAVAIAGDLRLPASQRKTIQYASKLHDVGKLVVPAEILAKPTRLTAAELEMVRAHAEAGYDILKEIEFGLPVAETVRQHHERLDGSGYPRKLVGESIMLEARIIAVADVAESMLSHRPYRPARHFEAMAGELREGRGLRYDAEAVDACLRVLDRADSPLRS